MSSKMKQKKDTETQEIPDTPISKTPRLTKLYEEVLKQIEELETELRPYRKTYEKLTNDPRLIEARQKIRELNTKLAPLKNEQAALARAAGSISLRDGVLKKSAEDRTTSESS